MIESSSGGSNIIHNDNAQQVSYDYGPDGQISRIYNRYEQRQQSRLINQSTVDDAYTYDAAGFLVVHLQKTQAQTDRDKWAYSEQTTYGYTDGRLAEATRQFSGYAGEPVFQGKTTYVYDGAGLLSRRTETTTYVAVPDSLKSNPQYQQQTVAVTTYQNGRAVDYVQTVNGVEHRPNTYRNGLLQSTTNGNSRRVYAYDAQSRLVKTDYYEAEQLKSTEERTYADAKVPTSSIPPFKGWAVNDEIAGKRGVWATHTFRSPLPNGTVYTSVMQAQHRLTGAGYPVETTRITTQTNYDSRGSSYQTKRVHTYTYDGFCD